MWFKVDDGLHASRKVRRVRKSHPDKPRDVAPLGIWVLAGSWCGERKNGGFIPLEVLEEWDDQAEENAQRLVDVRLWHREELDGEVGFQFNDWEVYNPTSGASIAGVYGNHVRWHVNGGKVDPECVHCPSDPGEEPPKSTVEDPPKSVPESGGDRVANPTPTRETSLTRPDPTRPDPSRLGGADASPAPTAEEATGKPKTKRATQRPVDLVPTDAHRALATELGVDLEREWSQFCDHHDAKGSTFKDWPAAFRTWLRNAQKFGRTTGGGASSNGGSTVPWHLDPNYRG